MSQNLALVSTGWQGSPVFPFSPEVFVLSSTFAKTLPLTLCALLAIALLAGCTTSESDNSSADHGGQAIGSVPDGESPSEDPCSTYCAEFDWEDQEFVDSLDGPDAPGPMFTQCGCDRDYPSCRFDGDCPSGTFAVETCESASAGYHCEVDRCVLSCGLERLRCEEAEEEFEEAVADAYTCEVDADCALSSIGSCGCGGALNVGADTSTLQAAREQRTEACGAEDFICDCQPPNQAYCDSGICRAHYVDIPISARDREINECQRTCAVGPGCSQLDLACSEGGLVGYRAACLATCEDDELRPEVLAVAELDCQGQLDWAISTFSLEQECNREHLNEDPEVIECRARCGEVAACDELIAFCGEEEAVDLINACDSACADPEARENLGDASEYECADLVLYVAEWFNVLACFGE